MVTLNTAGIVSRSTLRDCQNRLRKIRQECGDMDEGGGGAKGSGNEFQDMMKRFNTRMGEVLTLIKQRNDEERRNGVKTDIARMSHDVNMGIKDVKSQRDAIKALLEKAERELAKTNKKYSKKKDGLDEAQQKKLRDREQAAKDRRRAVENCNEAVEQIEKLNAERGMSAKDIANQRSTKGGIPAKAKNDTLDKYLKKASRRNKDPNDPPENGDPASDPTTAAQMKLLEEQKKEEQKALDRILQVCRELGLNATMIGQTLDEQNAKLDEVQGKADQARADLKGINRGLNKLLKDTKPMNMMINVMCFIFIISIVGFFLTETGVV